MYENIINNIIETATQINNHKAIYSPQYSFFDIILTECELNLFLESSSEKYLNSERIGLLKNILGIDDFSFYCTNSIINFTRNNLPIAHHLNSIIFEHGVDILRLKKEDRQILCTNGLKKHTFIVFFNHMLKSWTCNNGYSIFLDYSVPEKINISKAIDSRKKICFLGLNKTINNIPEIYSDAEILSNIPISIEDLSERLNEYKISIELDPSCIINSLCSIACGNMSIIMDEENILNQYSNIENLYIVKSISEMQEKIKQLEKQSYIIDTPNFNQKHRNFEIFNRYIKNILETNRNKGFII